MEIEKLKQLLGIEDTSEDAALEFIIADVNEIIMNYCHVDEVPIGLLHTSYRMAMDIYRNEAIGQQDAAVGSVSSITEGDTTTSFRQYVDDNFKETLLKDYRRSLNAYRKVRF